jgi:hypothetical protein
MLTAEELRGQLDYDPLTGVFTWRVKPRRKNIADCAGCIAKTGYVYISVQKKTYAAHRLAWLHTYGYWPSKEIDHINRVRSDNRIANLREATRAENCANRKKRPTRYRLNGVFLVGRRFGARVYVNGIPAYLGIYDTEIEAHAAYVAAVHAAFGAFARAE